MCRYSQFSWYRRTDFRGLGGGKSLAPPPVHWIPEAPPPHPGATPSCCGWLSAYLTRRSAHCPTLSFFPSFESVRVLAPQSAGWNWLVASLCPCPLPSFAGLCQLVGRGCFPLTGDSLAWWEQSGFFSSVPTLPQRCTKAFSATAPLGGPGTTLQSQGP